MEERYRFIQIIVKPETHKELRLLAAKKDMALGRLTRDIIEAFLQKENASASQS